jgi:two-component system NtrC family sensor kinase
MYGYDSLEEMNNIPVNKRYTPGSYAEGMIRCRSRQRGEYVPKHYEISIVRKNGETRHLEVFRKEVLWNNKAMTQVLYIDITENKLLRENLEKERQDLKLIIDSSPIIFFYKDKEGRFVLVNRSFAEALKTPAEEFVGKTVFDFYSAGIAQGMTNDDREVMNSGCPKLNILERYESAGGLRWVQTDKVPVFDKSGLVMGLVGFAVDITTRKKTEEANRVFSQAIATAVDAIAITDMKGTILYANKAMEDTYGYGERELLGKPVLILNANQKSAGEVTSELLEKGRWKGEIEAAKKNGETFPALLSISVIKDNEGNQIAMMGASRDITERRQAEELFKILATKSPVGVYILQKGRFVYTNPQFQEDTGYSGDELSGMESLSLVTPEDRKMVRHKAVQMLKGGRSVAYELRVINKRGEVRWASESVVPTQYRGKPAIIGSYQDITERKQMQEQLIVTDRLASIGELASGIAHEINNPLTGVIGLSDLLLARNELPPDVKEDLQIINREAHRTATVIMNLLTFARNHPQDKEQVDVNDVIKRALELRAYEQKVHNIRTVLHLDPGLPLLVANAFQLMQVFINIIINAEHFMIEANGKGRLKITTELAGEFVRITIADDGPGIAASNLNKIFNPFFTTKEVGKGTGLGLSICHGIVTEHGGRIQAKSGNGKGATFIVELPVSKTSEPT